MNGSFHICNVVSASADIQLIENAIETPHKPLDAAAYSGVEMMVWLKSRMNATVEEGDHAQGYTLVSWFEMLMESLQWNATCLVHHTGTPQVFHRMENLTFTIGASAVADTGLATIRSGIMSDEVTREMEEVVLRSFHLDDLAEVLDANGNPAFSQDLAVLYYSCPCTIPAVVE